MNVNTLVTKKGFQSYISLHCKENYVPKLIFNIKLGIVLTIMNSNSVCQRVCLSNYHMVI